MKKKYMFIIFPVMVLLFLLGFIIAKEQITKEYAHSGTTKPETSQKIISGEKTVEETVTSSTPLDQVKEQISGMSLDEKIGQLVLVGMDGYESNDNVKQLIEKYKVGGFIFFSKNIVDSNQFLSLVNSLKTLNTSNKIPLFLSIDQEGGRVSRMPREIANLPTGKKNGLIDNPDFSFQIGELIGEELELFGLNMDFAPVLDVNSNPNNPVIGDRAYGSEPGIVSKLGVQTMKGIESKNIISVVKHFPGHGDTAEDSHIGLPTVQNDIKRLESFELLPFEEAINNGADAVMVAHILLPKIDPENPASFSKRIITDILRTELRFNGVVITDDMTMGAISKNYEMGEASVKSILAGTDIILVCHYYEKEVAVINALKKAVEDGEISEERIDQSVYRILKLKNKYGVNSETVDTVDVEGMNDKIREILK